MTNEQVVSQSLSRSATFQIDPYVPPADEPRGSDVSRLSRKMVSKLARRIGKRLLTSDEWLDDLADALDGIDLADELSVTDKETIDEDEESDDNKKKNTNSKKKLNKVVENESDEEADSPDKKKQKVKFKEGEGDSKD